MLNLYILSLKIVIKKELAYQCGTMIKCAHFYYLLQKHPMKTIFMLCGLLAFGATAYADDAADTNLTNLTKYPLYVGFMTGYGNTDWSKLVEQDQAASYSTPSSASGSGGIIGALIGYQITPYISIEGQYIRYPDSSVNFLPSFLDTANYQGITHMTSKTNYFAIMPKIAAPFNHNRYQVFGTLGIADVERSDPLAHISNIRPTFGFGLSNIELLHWTFSIAFNYTPGTGTASETTSEQYIPYIYSGQLIIAYRL